MKNKTKYEELEEQFAEKLWLAGFSNEEIFGGRMGLGIIDTDWDASFEGTESEEEIQFLIENAVDSAIEARELKNQ